VTQLRKAGDAVSNYFDDLFAGIGHRGSSFCNLDGIDYSVQMTQDEATERVLIFELKSESDTTSAGQWRALKGLARISAQIDVWILRRRADGAIDFFDFRNSRTYQAITAAECRTRYEAWWNRRPCWWGDVPTTNERDDRWILEQDGRAARAAR
jgi:hypothetical protein